MRWLALASVVALHALAPGLARADAPLRVTPTALGLRRMVEDPERAIRHFPHVWRATAITRAIQLKQWEVREASRRERDYPPGLNPADSHALPPPPRPSLEERLTSATSGLTRRLHWLITTSLGARQPDDEGAYQEFLRLDERGQNIFLATRAPEQILRLRVRAHREALLDLWQLDQQGQSGRTVATDPVKTARLRLYHSAVPPQLWPIYNRWGGPITAFDRRTYLRLAADELDPLPLAPLVQDVAPGWQERQALAQHLKAVLRGHALIDQLDAGDYARLWAQWELERYEEADRTRLQDQLAREIESDPQALDDLAFNAELALRLALSHVPVEFHADFASHFELAVHPIPTDDGAAVAGYDLGFEPTKELKFWQLLQALYTGVVLDDAMTGARGYFRAGAFHWARTPEQSIAQYLALGARRLPAIVDLPRAREEMARAARARTQAIQEEARRLRDEERRTGGLPMHVTPEVMQAYDGLVAQEFATTMGVASLGFGSSAVLPYLLSETARTLGAPEWAQLALALTPYGAIQHAPAAFARATLSGSAGFAGVARGRAFRELVHLANREVRSNAVWHVVMLVGYDLLAAGIGEASATGVMSILSPAVRVVASTVRRELPSRRTLVAAVSGESAVAVPVRQFLDAERRRLLRAGHLRVSVQARGPVDRDARGTNARGGNRIALPVLPRPRCFEAGTRIALAEPGGERPRWISIEAIRPGALVWSWNEQTGENERRKVTQVFSRRAESTLALQLRSGAKLTTVRATGEHPFFVEGRGWVEAAVLRPGDVLRALGRETITVVDITPTGRGARVYNFEVEGTHTYFVAAPGGPAVLVHNRCDDRTLDYNGRWNRTLDGAERRRDRQRAIDEARDSVVAILARHGLVEGTHYTIVPHAAGRGVNDYHIFWIDPVSRRIYRIRVEAHDPDEGSRSTHTDAHVHVDWVNIPQAPAGGRRPTPGSAEAGSMSPEQWVWTLDARGRLPGAGERRAAFEGPMPPRDIPTEPRIFHRDGVYYQCQPESPGSSNYVWVRITSPRDLLPGSSGRTRQELTDVPRAGTPGHTHAELPHTFESGAILPVPLRADSRLSVRAIRPEWIVE